MAAFFLSSPSRAQPTRDLGVWVESHGSVPPIPDWFSCVEELDKKPYNKVKARACLNSVLLHPEVVKGKVSFHHYKERDALTFHVESPSLVVTDVDWGISAGDLATFHELLSINGGALRSGEPYDSLRDHESRLVLDLLLRSQGRQAGITRDVYLDFSNKTARVVFRI